MSNFNCDKCGAICRDSKSGYVTGCVHFPPDCCNKCGRLIPSKFQLENPGTEICDYCAAVTVNVDFHEEER